jgi:hypothetical protein
MLQVFQQISRVNRVNVRGITIVSSKRVDLEFKKSQERLTSATNKQYRSH